MSRDPDARFTAGRIVSAWAGEAILNDGGDDRSIGALAKRAAMPSRTREPEITAALKTTAGLPADPEIRENGREDRRAAAALGAEMTREGCLKVNCSAAARAGCPGYSFSINPFFRTFFQF